MRLISSAATFTFLLYVTWDKVIFPEAEFGAIPILIALGAIALSIWSYSRENVQSNMEEFETEILEQVAGARKAWRDEYNRSTIAYLVLGITLGLGLFVYRTSPPPIEWWTLVLSTALGLSFGMFLHNVIFLVISRPK